MFDTNKELNHNSWTIGGTLITNFSDNELLRYSKAIQEYEKDHTHNFVISAFAYDSYGIFLVNHNSLHWGGEMEDLSRFWKIYDSMKP